jgi:hypothetical protein
MQELGFVWLVQKLEEILDPTVLRCLTHESSGDPEGETYGDYHLGSTREPSNVRPATGHHGSDSGDRGRWGFAEDSAADFLLGRI